jgi:hypothetical protein
MNRRQFVSTGTLATAIASSTPAVSAAATPKRALMKLGATAGGGGEDRDREPFAEFGEDGALMILPPIMGGQSGGIGLRAHQSARGQQKRNSAKHEAVIIRLT